MNEQTPNPGPALPDPGSDAELDDLLGAYALDALDEDEHGRVDAYVSTHRQARLKNDVLAWLATEEDVVVHLTVCRWSQVWKQTSLVFCCEDDDDCLADIHRRANGIEIMR